MITAKSLATGGLGRFGNCCFTIAGCIGIAMRSGQQYAFPEWKTHDNAIFGEPVDNINDYLLKPLPPLASTNGFQDFGYFWGYKDIYLPTGNWSIDAHMQSEKFFKPYISLIREIFTFKNERPQMESVAIHYRGGDYINNPDAYHPRCSKEYYEKAISLFPTGTNFIVFTDEPDDAIQLFRSIKGYNIKLAIEAMREFSIRYEYENTFYVADFVFMKRCKSFITANSSFSLMAAILGDHPEKKIVCPKRWFGTQAGDIETKDIYPENAIII